MAERKKPRTHRRSLPLTRSRLRYATQLRSLPALVLGSFRPSVRHRLRRRLDSVRLWRDTHTRQAKIVERRSCFALPRMPGSFRVPFPRVCSGRFVPPWSMLSLLVFWNNWSLGVHCASTLLSSEVRAELPNTTHLTTHDHVRH